jgi:hypothetical protein
MESLLHNVQNASGAPLTFLFNGYRSSFLGVVRPERDTDHLPSSSGKVKNKCSYTSTPPVCLHGMDRDNFTVVPLQFYRCTFTILPSYLYNFTVVPLQFYRCTFTILPLYLYNFTAAPLQFYLRTFTILPPHLYNFTFVPLQFYRCTFTILPLYLYLSAHFVADRHWVTSKYQTGCIMRGYY